MPDPMIAAPAADAVVSTPAESSASPAIERSEAKGGIETTPTTAKPLSRSEKAEEVYTKVRDRLRKFRDAAEADETETNPAVAEPEKQAAAETKVVKEESSDESTAEKGGAPEASETAKPEAQEQEAAAEVTPAPTLPPLPAAHVRSLKAFGLTDDEIATTSPQVAAAIHARRNQEITRWAEQGRQQRLAQQPTQAAPAAIPTPVETTAATKPTFDIEALKKQYGDEPLIAALEAQQKEIENFRKYRQEADAQIEQRKLEALGNQVDQFFSNKELKAYHATYGTSSKSMTAEQAAAREKVLTLADAIVGGAKKEGVNLTLEEALQHAFDSVSAPLQKAAAREEIRKELTTRSKGISLKPGGRQAVPVNGRKELQGRVRNKLQEIFSS